MANKINEMVNHLEFLGYAITKLEKKTEKGPQLYIAKNPKKWSVAFWEINKEVVIYQINIMTDKKPTQPMDAFINLANEKLNITKVYHAMDEGNVSLRFEAFWFGEYAKSTFGVFLDYLTNDIQIFEKLDEKKLFF